MAAKTTHKPHPVAALFPMLSKDELEEMAADIAERGLLQPIMLDAEDQILDGRNREAACKIAKVQPRYETYGGDDPAGFALAVNLQRRSLTKGQAAMITAKAKSQGATYRNYTDGPSRGYISHAAVVLEQAPGLADAVIAGALGLDEAYGKAREIKTAAESDEARLERLRADAPDLADKVVEGELSLVAALTEVRERQASRRRDTEAAQAASAAVVSDLHSKTATILIGHRLGIGGLVDKDMIAAMRAAVDQLEELL